MQSQNTKQVGVLQNIWDEEFWQRSVWKSFQNREIIHTHGVTKRNESTCEDLTVG